MSLFYYDGVKFQKCLNIDSISGLPLDKRVLDYAFYTSENGTINTLLTLPKVEETCFYTPEEVPQHLYILTHRGWELILTEDMNVRPKGLHTKENVIIDVKEVLGCNDTDYYLLKNVPFKSIDANDGYVVLVRAVPNVNKIDVYNLPELAFTIVDADESINAVINTPASLGAQDKWNVPTIDTSVDINKIAEVNVIINN